MGNYIYLKLAIGLYTTLSWDLGKIVSTFSGELGHCTVLESV